LLFRQVLYRDLGCASYLLGDAGEAAVIDPRWDIDVYLAIARAERLTITHVIDTHDHADHVSGRARLARVTGARSHRPARDGEFRPGDIAPGDEIAVGAVRLLAVATPGHRPEHLSFAVSDLGRGPEPWMLLTGDSLLVGDLARPDLVLDTADGASAMHTSIRGLLELGDHVEVWPAHVGGSLCGGAGLSLKTSSTIGYERLQNPLLDADEPEFVAGLTSSIPPRPPNVDRIVALNQRGRDDGPGEVQQLSVAELTGHMRAGATVLDSRTPDAFDDGHLAAAVNLPISAAGVGTRAGWALDPAEPVVIVAEDSSCAVAMATVLHAVGLWQTVGYAPADRAGWERHGLPVAHAGSWDLEHLADRIRGDAVELVDVRERDEWDSGHVSGSHHVPLHRLRNGRSVELPARGLPIAVACAAGVRAAFAASLLRRAGHSDVVRVAGGGIPDLGSRGIRLLVETP
jgi:glyoxylase-like metal-dependent hydrolase (beta-lactamase superfamily II)/rhodanese-related sulfurtransferase